MKPIPKGLKGTEVKKFEEYVEDTIKLLLEDSKRLSNSIYLKRIEHYLTWKIKQTNEFINQDFTPDMIEEYFCWNDIRKYDAGHIYYWHSQDNSRIVKRHVDTIHFFNSEASFVIVPFNCIKTLSDFIDAALNSEIKLRWKI